MNHPTKIATGAFLLATLNVLIACSDGRQPTGEPSASSRVGGLDVRLWLDPDPPKQQGLLWLELRDEDGGAVDAAQVDVGWLMPAMGAIARDERESGDRGGRVGSLPCAARPTDEWVVDSPGQHSHLSDFCHRRVHAECG